MAMVNAAPTAGTTVRRWAAGGIAAAAAVLLLAACAAPGSAGSAPGPTDTPPAGTSPAPATGPTLSTGPTSVAAASPGPTTVTDPLTGREFVSTSVTGHSLVPGTRISIEFRSDNATPTLHATAGCNTFSGVYELAGGLLTVPQATMTEMGCTPSSLMDQDQWWGGLLSAGLMVKVDHDTLTLSSGQIRIVLTDRTVAEPDLPLVGTSWVLDGIVDGDAVSSVPVGVTGGQQIVGNVMTFQVCQSGRGTVAIDGDRVAVTDLELSAGPSCAGDSVGEVESSVVDVLRDGWTFAIDGDRMTVTATGGKGLMFVSTTPGGGPTEPPTPQPEPETGAPGTSSPETGVPGTSSPETGGPKTGGPAPTTTPGSIGGLKSGIPVTPVSEVPPGRHDSISPPATPAN